MKPLKEDTSQLCTSESADEERVRAIKKALAQLRKYRGKLPAGFMFNREEANERR